MTLSDLLEVERTYSKDFGRSIDGKELSDGRDPKIVLNYKTIFPYPKTSNRSFLFKDPVLENYYYRYHLNGEDKGMVDIIRKGVVLYSDDGSNFNGDYELYSEDRLLQIQYLVFEKDEDYLLTRVANQLWYSKLFTPIENGFEKKRNVKYFKHSSGVTLTIYTVKGLVEYNTLRKYYGELKCLPFVNDIDRSKNLYFSYSGTDATTEEDLVKCMLDVEDSIKEPFKYTFSLRNPKDSLIII